MSNKVKTESYQLGSDDEAREPFLENGKSEGSSPDSVAEQAPADPQGKFGKGKRILILCSTALVLMIVVVVGVLLTKEELNIRASRDSTPSRKLSLEDIYNGKYDYRTYRAKWDSDRSYFRWNGGKLDRYDVEAKTVTTLLSPEDGSFSHTKISPDKKWLLFANNTKTLYRHSFYGDYFLKNLETKEITKLKVPNEDSEQIRYCGWSSVGNALVFVHKCNIYYVSNAAQHTYYKITSNGVSKKVFNGVPDWVYEEEILASTNAIEFSPDGKYMAFVTFDASLVPFYRFPHYGKQSQAYPTIEKIAYPKAGFPNPTIKITVINLEHFTKKTEKKVVAPRTELIPPADISSGDYYYSVMKFNSKSEVFVQWLNRAQNKTTCVLYGPNDPSGSIVEGHEIENGWVDDDYQAPLFSNDGSFYITMLPQDVAGKGAFRHLAKVQTSNKKGKNDIAFLTSGEFTVVSMKCWNQDDGIIYFTSTESAPRERHIYSYNMTSKQKNCVSCGLIKDEDGIECSFFKPAFSKKCSWMTVTCDGPSLPSSILYNLKRKIKKTLIDNMATRTALKKEKDLPIVEFYKITVNDVDIWVKESRPKNFKPTHRYPVLFDVYGGPSHQKVTTQYSQLSFDSYFVSSHDIIVVNFDARGSGNYGYKFMHAVYRKLGYYETQDAIAVAEYLQQKSYVDPERIAIWGWSYGGFYSANVLAMSGDIIKTAVSVAPVTDWRYYDTVYSERYMGLPNVHDNLQGYIETSVMHKAKKFKGKNFFLIHGTSDDNVHFQNSAQLVNALIDAKVDFRSQFYTDRDHSIRSGGHIYYEIADFLVKKLTGQTQAISTTFGIDDERR